MGTYREFEGAINSSCQVTTGLRSGGAPLKEVGELCMTLLNATHLPVWLAHWQPSSKLHRVERLVSPGPLEAARGAGSRVYVPSCEVFRSFKYATD